MDEEGVIRDLFSDSEKQRYATLVKMETEATSTRTVEKDSTVLLDEDVKKMLEVKVATLYHGPRREPNMRLKRVAEAKKQRARICGWPKRVNEIVRKAYRSQMSLRDVVQIVDRTTKRYVITADLTCSFWQVEASEELIFRYGSNLFKFNRMNMGSVTSAERMHMITTALARFPGITEKCVVDIHIDNIRFQSDNKSLLQRLKTHLQQRFAKYNVTINDTINVVEQHEFFGIRFNTAMRTAEIADKTREKLNDAKATIAGTMTLRQFLSLIGRTIYVSRATRHSLDKHYIALQFTRRLQKLASQEVNLDQQIKISTELQNHMAKWTQQLIDAKPFSLADAPLRKVFLFTDASDDGAGAVLIHRNTVHVFGSHFDNTTRRRHINTKELAAVTIALRAFAGLLKGTAITHFIDNVAAAKALRTGHAPHE